MIQHKHLLVRAECLEMPDSNSTIMLNDSMYKLVKDIGMKVALPPRCIYIKEKGNEGWTGNVGIETSHIAYHMWDTPDANIMKNKEAGLIQLDVYTCGCLTDDNIESILLWLKPFKPVDILYCVIDRSKDFSIENAEFIRKEG